MKCRSPTLSHPPCWLLSLRFCVRVNVCLNSARQSSVALHWLPTADRGPDHPRRSIAWDALEPHAIGRAAHSIRPTAFAMIAFSNYAAARDSLVSGFKRTPATRVSIQFVIENELTHPRKHTLCSVHRSKEDGRRRSGVWSRSRSLSFEGDSDSGPCLFFSGLTCSFVAVYLTSVQFILQLKLLSVHYCAPFIIRRI